MTTVNNNPVSAVTLQPPGAGQRRQEQHVACKTYTRGITAVLAQCPYIVAGLA